MGDLSENSTSCVKMSGVYLRKVMKEHPPETESEHEKPHGDGEKGQQDG